jgi:[ribosomal protein S18]-alanine N-acetyltransferase
MILREMLERDLEAVARLQSETFEGEAKSLGFTKLQLEVELNRENARVWVLEARGHGVVGVLIAWLAAGELSLLNVAVAKTHQGKGFGKRLVQNLIEEAHRVQASGIFLEVRTDNTVARGLYKHCGFEDGRIRRGYYHDGSDAIEMAWLPASVPSVPSVPSA